ncbi:PHP domain-containing protein [Clostridium ljungdahlii]|uniref:DNA polymerase III PolC-type n=1 Tax=Clostridium ljungdahlii TaxID=1538 RepID=A0A166SFR3_9CLOT|nr:PHP domain-containing protein [Clostridium ljungdahlii]OAA92131.1 DNA polymerase III PolC-type [Clostridium ljungdahlii]
MYKKGDFHLHTTASDGNLFPSKLVCMAKREGVDIIAITDHDTLSGIDEALKEGEKIGIKVIPGIELSTLYENKSVHILGYFKDISHISPKFKDFLKEMNLYRINRAKKIVNNLYKFFNIKLDFDSILKIANGVVARPHIAKAIINAGYNYSFDYIFSNFIGDSSPAYVPNKKLSTTEGIKMLTSLNAMVVLAHPILVKDINIEDLIKLPFHGIEAIYPANKVRDTERFIKYAKKYKKIITAGSDFHSTNKKSLKHGHTIGEVYLEENQINDFLSKLKSLSDGYLL